MLSASKLRLQKQLMTVQKAVICTPTSFSSIFDMKIKFDIDRYTDYTVVFHIS